jgi:DNA polymerase (family 10)
MDKAAVVEALEELALLLELADANPFKVRAFTNGARALEGLPGPVDEALRDGTLKATKGIGAGLLGDIKALVETGRLPALEELRAATPAGLVEMMGIPGLGPKKVKAIHAGLGIASVGELEYAVLENRLVDLPGFGAKTQAKVGDAIAAWKRHRGKRLLSDVLPAAEALVAHLATAPGIAAAALAGGLRRRAETVRDVDLVIAAADAAAAEAAVAAAPGVERTDAGLKLTGLLPLDVAVVAPDAFGAALLVGTGGPAYVDAAIAAAAGKGLRLDATGLWRGTEQVAAVDEAAAYAAIGLPAVAPELREDAAPRVPAAPLITATDLQGVFHVHTTYSDGTATIRDMALAAKALGWRYVGISDHSEAAFYAKGLTRARIAEQRREIDALNAELEGITVLHGIEADILADGSLDYDDETLASLDFVIGSVHSRFGQDREAMTARLVKALSHPRLTMLGHMSGRLLLSRDPYDFDLEAVFQAAAAHGKAIELNANPHRLDVDWRHLRRARELGIAIAINPDAHSPEGLAHVRWGVDMARKAGLTADDVFNTGPLEAVRPRLAARA